MNARNAMPFGLLACWLLVAGCPGGSGPAADAYRLCALSSACTDEGTSYPFGPICDTLLQVQAGEWIDGGSGSKLAASRVDCLARATDCDSFRTCSQADAGQQAQCDEGDAGQFCDAQVSVSCSEEPDQPATVLDCGAAGLECVEDEALDVADCGLGPCDPDGDSPRCDGDLLVTCTAGGAWVSKDCSADGETACVSDGQEVHCRMTLGGTCGPDADGEPACVGQGAACDPDTFENRCEGSVMVSCRAGTEARKDCRELRPWYTCGPQPVYGYTGCGPAPDAECDATFAETCAAGVITFCSQGEIQTLDCGRYGLAGCDSGILDGQAAAWCVE